MATPCAAAIMTVLDVVCAPLDDPDTICTYVTNTVCPGSGPQTKVPDAHVAVVTGVRVPSNRAPNAGQLVPHTNVEKFHYNQSLFVISSLVEGNRLLVNAAGAVNSEVVVVVVSDVVVVDVMGTKKRTVDSTVQCNKIHLPQYS